MAQKCGHLFINQMSQFIHLGIYTFGACENTYVWIHFTIDNYPTSLKKMGYIFVHTEVSYTKDFSLQI